MTRLLITGASGTLGQAVARLALVAGWTVIGTYHTRPLDLPIEWHMLTLGQKAAVTELVTSVKPTAIIHTAYRPNDPGLWVTTADGAAQVALAARQVGARLVHISSDALFDGSASPYDETAVPRPITPYGAAKAAAETAVAAIDPAAAIIRTSLLLRRDPPSVQEQLVFEILQGRRSDRLFSDEYRCPIAVEDLAVAALELAGNDYAGLLHVAGPEALSRHELGRLIATAAGFDPEQLPHTTVAATGLRRPTDVRLISKYAATVLTSQPRSVRQYLGLPPARDA